jgi:hypothetical protein
MQTQSFDSVARDILTRTLAVVGLLGIALIHTLDAIPTFSELPYKAWLYVGLIVGSVIVAGMLVGRPTRWAWTAAGTLVAGAIAAFVYSRTVGLPGAPDDVGNWAEPLGVASLFVETIVLAVAGYAVAAIAPVRAAAGGGIRRLVSNAA